MGKQAGRQAGRQIDRGSSQTIQIDNNKYRSKQERTRVGLLILISCVIEPPLNGGNKLPEGESSCSWNVYNVNASN